MNAATVIGLGQMGTTLAKLLLQAGYRVTIWNRTMSKATELVQNGAVAADNVESAIAASPIAVICVFDYVAAAHIFDQVKDVSVLAGKTILQLTTGSPEDATESNAWATRHSALYLDGAIQVAPEQMARPDTTIFVSGAEAAFNTSNDVLKIFGGNVRYLGDNVSAAAAMDLASLSFLYGSLLGFFHAVRIAEAAGFRIDLLGDIIRQITPGFTEFFQYEAGVIQSGDFRVTQSPLAISLEATTRIQKASRAYGINTEVSQLAESFMLRAKEAGLEGEELASLIKVFRK